MIRTRPDSDPEARFRAALSTDRLDGGTLCLVVEPGGRSRDGAQRLTVDGKRRDLGLGGYPYVGLGEARAAAFSNRQLPRRGGDRTAVLQRWPVPTFRTACERVDAAATWKGYGPVDRRRALERYCGSILDRHFNQIRRADVIGILASHYLSSLRDTHSKDVNSNAINGVGNNSFTASGTRVGSFLISSRSATS